MKLIVEKLTVARGSRVVISDLSLTVAEGEALLLTGANGAGKTTLIRAMAGLIAPLAGQILLEGGNADLDLPQQCHYAAHSNALKASLTVEENLRFWGGFLNPGEMSGEDQSKVLDTALEQLKLAPLAGVPAAYLSAGQKRRAGLGRILMAKRSVWLLDEPTVSLDAASAAALAHLVNAHTAGGGIAVIATHLPMDLTAPRTLHLRPLALSEAA